MEARLTEVRTPFSFQKWYADLRKEQKTVGNNIETLKRDIADLEEKSDDLTLDINLRDRDLYEVMSSPQTILHLTNVAPFSDTPSRL
jgi:hypothetical protein